MARTPVGTVPQRQSRTALFSYIAGRLAGVCVTDQARFYEVELRVRIGRDGAEHAAGLRRHPQPGKRARGPAPAQPQPVVRPEDAALREWLLVEEHKLDLDSAMIRFPGSGRRQSDLLRGLDGVHGVRQVIELSEQRDVLAIVIFDGRDDRRRLRAELEELAWSMIWEDIESESHDPATATWKHLARHAAGGEGLLASNP